MHPHIHKTFERRACHDKTYGSSLSDGRVPGRNGGRAPAYGGGPRARLVYRTIGINYIIKDKIQKFNAANKEYYIEYRDYSEEVLRWSGDKNTPVYQNALSRLYAEIATGRCPDILDETVPLDRLARQGALEDLWPWIDSDPEISRDGLMEHVLECLEVDGKLPQVCSGFQIETAVTSAAVAGNRTGWTMEEMVDAFGGMPEFYFAREDDGNLAFPMFHRFDRRSTLYYLVNMNLSRYVDLETGKCDFDNDDQGPAAAGRQRGRVPGVSLGGQAAPLCPDAFGTQGPGDRRCTVRRPGAAGGLRSAALGRGYYLHRWNHPLYRRGADPDTLQF